MVWELWWLLPTSVLIATVAMASGVGGAVFFSPLFLLVLGLEPAVAIGTALLTELFGFGSGLVAYVRSKRIDYRLAGELLMFSVPGAVAGVLLAEHIPGTALKAAFAAGILFLGYQLFSSWHSEEQARAEGEIRADTGPHEKEIVDREGTVFRYSVRKKAVGRAFAAIGGTFVGMISVGLAELEEFELVARCKVPSQVAVATSVFMVVITVLVAVIGHGWGFLSRADPAAMREVLTVAAFSVPGVVVGGQLGPIVGGRVDPDTMKVGISLLFMGVGLLMFATLALS